MRISSLFDEVPVDWSVISSRLESMLHCSRISGGRRTGTKKRRQTPIMVKPPAMKNAGTYVPVIPYIKPRKAMGLKFN
jgi:hypothetical protein